MKILTCTNAYPPQTGGTARSVQMFVDEHRSMGHQTLVVAPQSEGAAIVQDGVIRVPGLHGLPASDPILSLPESLTERVNEFGADIVHAHHPLLLGGVALRMAAIRDVPIVFTHHLRFESAPQQGPFDSPVIQRFVAESVTRYCNLCDAVVAPSQRTAAVLRQQGVRAPITVIPTGVEVERYVQGESEQVRTEFGIPQGAFVVGLAAASGDHRWSSVLTEAISLFLTRNPKAHLLLFAGDRGERPLSPRLRSAQMRSRAHCVDGHRESELHAAYAAMDVLAACGGRELDRRMIVEALSAGVPVIAVEDDEARELVQDGRNGRLLPRFEVKSFAAALEWVAELTPSERIAMHAAIHSTAQRLMLRESAARLIELYAFLIEQRKTGTAKTREPPPAALGWMDEELKILSNMAGALGDALLRS